MNIKYLKHNQINKKKWDYCIQNANNSLVYGYSWFLDIVSKNWDALLLGDYETIMPLPVKKKYGISYIIQPKYTQQLGLFSQNTISKDVVKEFISHIPKKFILIDIHINSKNKLRYLNKDWKIENRVNCELNLNQTYETLYKHFSKNTKRNIKKAQNNGVRVICRTDLDAIIELKTRASNFDFNSEHKKILKKIIPYCIEKNIGKTYAVYNSEDKLISTVFFIISNQRATYFMVSSDSEGLKKRAMFAIIDKFIKDHSKSNITLDFEGSVIDSIARFFYGFGAETINYTHIHLNRLPWFINRLRS